MPELSNLLRQRLAVTKNGAAQEHPDADTLTAYVEQCLPAAERQTVITHLTLCDSCREVVLLSQPEIPELAVQTVLAPSPVSPWRRLFTPALGLAASVAAMAIIAFLVLQLPHRSVQQSAIPPAQENQQAKANAIGDQAAPAEAKSPAPVQSAETEPPASSARADIAIPAKESRTATSIEEARARAAMPLSAPAVPPPAKAPALTAGLQKKDYVNTNFFAANSADSVVLDGEGNGNVPSAPQPQPQPGTTGNLFAARGKITAFSDIPPNPSGNSNVRLLTPNPPQQHFGCTVCKIVQATAHTLRLHSPAGTPALRSSTLGNSALGAPGMFSSTLQKNQPSEIAAAPEKTDAGALAGSDAFSSNAMSVSSYRASDSTPTAWKVVGGKLIKSTGQSQWEDAYPVAGGGGIEFSFVSARGADVWAGGSHAAILHSRDGGLTWENVKLGEAASGHIVSILAATLNVQVKTSDNQTWSSTDGGKTWTMRSE